MENWKTAYQSRRSYPGIPPPRIKRELAASTSPSRSIPDAFLPMGRATPRASHLMTIAWLISGSRSTVFSSSAKIVPYTVSFFFRRALSFSWICSESGKFNGPINGRCLTAYYSWKRLHLLVQQMVEVSGAHTGDPNIKSSQ